MPPQPGVFSLSYPSSTHKPRTDVQEMSMGYAYGIGVVPSPAGPGAPPPPPPLTSSSSHHHHHHQQQQHIIASSSSSSHLVGTTSSTMHPLSHPGHGHAVVSGPGSRMHGIIDDGKKDKRRRELSGKLGKEMSDRRDELSPAFPSSVPLPHHLSTPSSLHFISSLNPSPIHISVADLQPHPPFPLSSADTSGRHFSETISALHSISIQLSTRPETLQMYNLKLYPRTVERSAILAQIEYEEQRAVECIEMAYEEERDRVEEEWKRGRERVRERLVEGIEERRRRAREEKDGEGTVGDASLDSSSRPHITRKLRNKLGTSPPPTPLGGGLGLGVGLMGAGGVGSGGPGGAGLISNLPITTGPFPNPHSLSVDELPSPFPLPLISSTFPNGSGSGSGGGGGGGGASGGGGGGGGGAGGGGGRKARGKGNGGHPGHVIGGLGKSLSMLSGCKETEIDSDLGEIRRGSKRRRAAAATIAKS